MRWLGAVEAHSTPRLIASRRTCFVSSEVTLLEDDGGIDKKLDTVRRDEINCWKCIAVGDMGNSVLMCPRCTSLISFVEDPSSIDDSFVDDDEICLRRNDASRIEDKLSADDRDCGGNVGLGVCALD